ncbi:MAG: cytochrome c/FTR1 family iron permease [Pseudomonadales bacterium]|nr:cytochrome c/FTR1 family iron permease [Pseudomonadales bacterium]
MATWLPAIAEDPQTILHLLDYVAVDYADAVEHGQVKSADEYAEMLEFTARAHDQLRTLEPNPRQSQIVAEAARLMGLVRDRAEPDVVADSAAGIRRELIAAYRLALTPARPPQIAVGRALYATHCATCHGDEGRGDGPGAVGLAPAPSDFHDLDRMARRSAYGLYSTITLGVDGTAMGPYGHLGDDERWALAFFVASMGTPETRVEDGARLWSRGEAHGLFTSLGPLATLSRDEVAGEHGEPAARVFDYLRTFPEAVRPAPLAFARHQLAAALDAYRRGDRAAARSAALAGYLEGFELAESSLASVDAPLMREIEGAMVRVRTGIENAAPVATLERETAAADALLATAQERLAGATLSRTTAFVTALLILLREGLEAILVLAAIIAFVVKTGRRDALPWVHAGWITALALGAATWLAATYFVQISGASRELTEGVSALLAAVMLLYVGYWLHGKSYAHAWTHFLRDQVGQALARRTLWAMAGVSFLAVYRELFEIVLFYQTLWLQAGTGGRTAVLGGIGAAAVLLAAIGFAVFRYSLRLPLAPFFAATSLLLAVLALIFTGHGVAALQEAGLFQTTALPFAALPMLGVYPSVEALGAQAAVLVAIAITIVAARRRATALADPARDPA